VSLTRRTRETTRTFAITNDFSATLIKAVVGWSDPATPTMPWSTMSTCVFDASLRRSSCRPGEKRGSLRGTKYILSAVGLAWRRSRCKALSRFGRGEFRRDGGSQSLRTHPNVLRCGLGIATRRCWGGSSGNSYIIDLVRGLELDLESKDGSKGRKLTSLTCDYHVRPGDLVSWAFSYRLVIKEVMRDPYANRTINKA